ncbi:MAG: methyltransferase domain-containing protein [Magnetococcales bacterium]|nr:methyltransferase domain-containing protein [Magnetococcales bacterium]MBF0157857.1 methyltransferase domain-containing protein [Magnetococcales bacterium]
MLGNKNLLNVRSEWEYLYIRAGRQLMFELRYFGNWLRHGHLVRQRAIADYWSHHPVRRIHLGAGGPVDELPGFLNSRIHGAVPIDITKRLPFPDSSISTLFSSHLVEHIHRRAFDYFLREVHRVLAPGGIQILSIPSIHAYAEALYGREATDENRRLFQRRYAHLCGDDFFTPCHMINYAFQENGHHFLYDEFYMEEMAKKIGFAELRLVAPTELPDPEVRQLLTRHKDKRWHLESQTFVWTR